MGPCYWTLGPYLNWVVAEIKPVPSFSPRLRTLAGAIGTAKKCRQRIHAPRRIVRSPSAARARGVGGIYVRRLLDHEKVCVCQSQTGVEVRKLNLVSRGRPVAVVVESAGSVVVNNEVVEIGRACSDVEEVG
jgi:hypothetical protein